MARLAFIYNSIMIFVQEVLAKHLADQPEEVALTPRGVQRHVQGHQEALGQQ